MCVGESVRLGDVLALQLFRYLKAEELGASGGAVASFSSVILCCGACIC